MWRSFPFKTECNINENFTITKEFSVFSTSFTFAIFTSNRTQASIIWTQLPIITSINYGHFLKKNSNLQACLGWQNNFRFLLKRDCNFTRNKKDCNAWLSNKTYNKLNWYFLQIMAEKMTKISTKTSLW